MSKSHGFNSLHGRMAPVASGAFVANKNLRLVGVSGDGDTASIGLGSFCHMIRRNLPILYIVENNGVYGLTKGQFSATADQGSSQKSGELNPYTNIDICTLALDMGCTFVARSFSGDAKQLVPLLNAAIRHKGTAVIDVISPCVTFANHEGSTKSYDAVRASAKQLQELGFVQPRQEIKVDYPEGSTHEISLHDGSRLILRKIDSHEHDVARKDLAMSRLQMARSSGEVLTGLFYWNKDADSIDKILALPDRPLSQMSGDELRPNRQALEQLLSRFE